METIVIPPSGRPDLERNEVEVFAVANVGVQPHSAKYILRLTNFRLIFQCTQHEAVHQVISLEHVQGIDAPRSILFFTRNDARIRLNVAPHEVQLQFYDNRDAFVARLQKQLETRSWAQRPKIKEMPGQAPTGPAPGQPAAPKFSTRSAGLSGILNTFETQNMKVQLSMEEAFKDLDGLMMHAGQMVTLASQLSQKLGSSADGSDAAFHQQIMHKMGIQSPVTRQVVSGNLYYEELARELSQFLETRVLVKPDSAIEDDLGIQHNVILMSDLYCIFNRARGTELVSPDDLLKACLLLEPLQLRARLHKFEGSGVSYVTSEKYSDEVIIKRLVELLKKRGPMTTAQLATSQKISAPLAQQYMKAGEDSGALCRDESPEGIFMWPNVFV